jgi:hypothetical protein
MANSTNNETLGVFSLRAAAWGIVLPMLVITFLVAFHADLVGENRTTIAWLIGTVFLTLEVFAVLAGLGAWSSAAGKIGTLLALVLLAGGLAAGVAVFDWPVAMDDLTGAQAVPAPKPVEHIILEPVPPPAPPPALSPAPPPAPAPREPEPPTPVPERPVRRGSTGELFPNVPPQK